MTRDEALSAMKKSSPFRTICEVHREIFELVTDETVKERVLEAFIMGKKMDAKLRAYKQDWDEGFYEENADRGADRRRRKA